MTARSTSTWRKRRTHTETAGQPSVLRMRCGLSNAEAVYRQNSSRRHHLHVDAVTLNDGKIGTVDVQVVTVDKTGRWTSDYYYDATSGFIEYEHVRRIS